MGFLFLLSLQWKRKVLCFLVCNAVSYRDNWKIYNRNSFAFSALRTEWFAPVLSYEYYDIVHTFKILFSGCSWQTQKPWFVRYSTIISRHFTIAQNNTFLMFFKRQLCFILQTHVQVILLKICMHQKQSLNCQISIYPTIFVLRITSLSRFKYFFMYL